jgi:hypothetical protein
MSIPIDIFENWEDGAVAFMKEELTPSEESNIIETATADTLLSMYDNAVS